MAVLVLRHRVRHYDTWRAIFDDHAATRRAHGAQSERIFREEVDPDEILIYLEWDDANRAYLFARSADLREVMARSGVADRPDAWVLSDEDRPEV